MKFSIIMPVYNVEKYVEKAIKSIFSQTYDNYELIIIDDGSTDKSATIIKDIIKDNEKASLYQKNNGGLSDARNYGLRYVTGDYIWFIDSDDYIREDALEILNRKSGADIISFGYYKVVNKKNIKVNIKNKHLDSKIRYLLNTPSACMKVYKTDFFKKNKLNFEKGRYYEDLGLTPTFIKYTDSLSFIDDSLYYYVIRNNSIMTEKSFNEKKDDRFWAINNIINILDNKFIDEEEYLAIKHLIIMYSIDILFNNKEIYKPRLEQVKQFFNQKFPKYYKNKYLKNESLFTRAFITFYKYNCIFICKLMIKVGGYL